jgi:hypothetical protein
MGNKKKIRAHFEVIHVTSFATFYLVVSKPGAFVATEITEQEAKQVCDKFGIDLQKKISF